MTIERALTLDPDEDQYQDLVRELQRRNDEETYAAAVALTRSDDPARRELGVDILGQLGFSHHEADRVYLEPSTTLLLDLVTTEQHPRVLTAILFAFGHIHDSRTIGPTVAFAAHPDEHVRFGLVHGLSGHDDDRALDTLVALTVDPVDRVRDWATFELGSILDRDTPQVREALAARLRDPHRDTHVEAGLIDEWPP